MSDSKLKVIKSAIVAGASAAPAFDVAGLKSIQCTPDHPTAVAALAAAANGDTSVTLSNDIAASLANHNGEVKIPAGRTMVLLADREKVNGKMVTTSLHVATMPTTAAIYKAKGGKDYIYNLALSRLIGKFGQSRDSDSRTVFEAADYISTSSTASPFAKPFGAWLAAQARELGKKVKDLRAINASTLRKSLTSRADAVELWGNATGSKMRTLSERQLMPGLEQQIDGFEAAVKTLVANPDTSEAALADANFAVASTKYYLEALQDMAANWETAPLTVESLTDVSLADLFADVTGDVQV
ncbi:MAG: hypothetical protein L3J05_05835 [Robiginitomaculum sp.]|nr:hypothetical protein [Robiginitomaculum sp.]